MFIAGHNRDDISLLTFISKTPLPDDFLFGVANSGYQVEGGYNRPGFPHNNFSEWENIGRFELTGDACHFWDRHDEHIELARSLGLKSFRLSIEWARIQPSYHARVSPPPAVDESAVRGYASIISKIMDSGMTPIVTLHHFTHPAWCGLDFWLQEGMAGLFVGYAADMVLRINEYLMEQGKKPLMLLVLPM
jgi:beta-glucosidase/6-phospho-beta-glucosidase/beta-galactosidase